MKYLMNQTQSGMLLLVSNNSAPFIPPSPLHFFKIKNLSYFHPFTAAFNLM